MNIYPLISVNITTFNRCSMLMECLASVFRQSYPNLEIVIVDDCSSDSTEIEIAKLLDSRIKYYRNSSNKGNAYSRNKALLHSRGTYIAFMDDDDIWIDPFKLSKQVSFLESNPYIHFPALVFNFFLIQLRFIYVNMFRKPLKYSILCGNGLIYSPTVVVRASIFSLIGAFDVNLRKGVDSDFYRRYILKTSFNIHFLADVTTSINVNHSRVRMTRAKSLNWLIKSFHSTFYAFQKYPLYFLSSPLSITIRLLQIPHAILVYFSLV